MEPNQSILLEVLAAAPEALIAVDAEARISYANEQAAQLLELSSSELAGAPLEPLISDARQLLADVHAERASTPISSDVTVHRRDGSTFTAEISSRRLRTDSAELTILCIHRTEPLGAAAASASPKQETSTQVSALAELAESVAHDLNNLLGVILNYSSLLLQSVSEPLARQDIEQIQGATDRAAELSRSLMRAANEQLGVRTSGAARERQHLAGVARSGRYSAGELDG